MKDVSSAFAAVASSNTNRAVEWRGVVGFPSSAGATSENGGVCPNRCRWQW